MQSKLTRENYSHSLDQLITISCILAGFAFSGLIALPGIESQLFTKIVQYFKGDFNLAFYTSFYALFFSTICFLCAIMTVLVYKANNYTIPFSKLKRIYLITNLVFSFAIAALLISVIAFGIPNLFGIIGAFIVGFGVAGSFIWENMLPHMRSKREKQVEEENKATVESNQDKAPEQKLNKDISKEAEEKIAKTGNVE